MDLIQINEDKPNLLKKEIKETEHLKYKETVSMK